MANIKFIRTNQNKIEQELIKHEDGQLIITDTGNMYIDFPTGQHIMINGELKRLVIDLQTQINDLKYVPVKIQSFTSTPSYIKYGQSSLTGFTFSWTLNDASIKSQQWNNIPINISQQTYSPTSALTSHTHQLTVTDNRDYTATSSLTIPVYDAIFYGVNNSTSITSLENISTPKWQASHAKTFSVNAAANQYIYYACVDEKEPVFKVGGFEGGFSQIGTVAYSNGRTYKVFRSDNKGLGSTTVEVK